MKASPARPPFGNMDQDYLYYPKPRGQGLQRPVESSWYRVASQQSDASNDTLVDRDAFTSRAIKFPAARHVQGRLNLPDASTTMHQRSRNDRNPTSPELNATRGEFQAAIPPQILHRCHAYGYKLIDGTYRVLTVAGTAPTGEGLIIVPEPWAPVPEGAIQESPEHSSKTEKCRSSSNSPIQKVFSPVTIPTFTVPAPTAPTAPTPTADEVQAKIDQIITTPQVPKPQGKIYCTHWIHRGTCMFAHSGCRFLHIIPLDPDTLGVLGLRGLPGWWLKTLAPEQRQLVLEEHERLKAQKNGAGQALDSPDHRNAPLMPYPRTGVRAPGSQLNPEAQAFTFQHGPSPLSYNHNDDAVSELGLDSSPPEGHWRHCDDFSNLSINDTWFSDGSSVAAAEQQVRWPIGAEKKKGRISYN